jgi:hypothetical protein
MQHDRLVLSNILNQIKSVVYDKVNKVESLLVKCDSFV